MMNQNYEELKDKYADGYRCIYSDTSDGCTLHLKQFETEKSCTISSHDKMEIGEMFDFLDKIELTKKTQGYDSICSGKQE
jgi:hypothetical protein